MIRDGTAPGESAVRVDATVRGRVQGVGFRYHVLRAAAGLDVSGWVANAPDGSVRCVAEGDRPSLERLVEALREGPAGAIVERVDAIWGPAADAFEGFTVRSLGHRGD